MTKDTKNIIIMLLTLALFTGALIEIREGSTFIGTILITTATFMITRIKFKISNVRDYSKLHIYAGSLILLADVIFNINTIDFSTPPFIGTIDTMVFFLGLSIIAYGTNMPQMQKMGEFGFYITTVFIILFITIYTIMGFDFLQQFNHYLILLPTAAIIKAMGIPIEVISTATVQLSGVEDITIIIGGPCSGLYSMFLLIGIVIGYSRVEKINTKQTASLAVITIVVAYVSNLTRVVILYIVAYLDGGETMVAIHTHIGWLIFAIVAAGLMYFIDIKFVHPKKET